MAEIDRRPNAFVNQFIIQPEEIILGAKLGEGAFGVVYAAEVRASHVACKVPKKNFLSKTQHEEFVREVEIMRYAALSLSLYRCLSRCLSRCLFALASCRSTLTRLCHCNYDSTARSSTPTCACSLALARPMVTFASVCTLKRRGSCKRDLSHSHSHTP